MKLAGQQQYSAWLVCHVIILHLLAMLYVCIIYRDSYICVCMYVCMYIMYVYIYMHIYNVCVAIAIHTHKHM